MKTYHHHSEEFIQQKSTEKAKQTKSI